MFDNKAYQKEYYKKNKDKSKAKSKAWYAENKDRAAALSRKAYEIKKQQNPIKVIYDSIQQRCKKRGIPFNLGMEDLVIPEVCPYLGVQLTLGGHGKPHKFSVSVDRIIPELGYVKGNIQIISHLANRMKQDATEDELLLFANGVLKRHG